MKKIVVTIYISITLLVVVMFFVVNFQKIFASGGAEKPNKTEKILKSPTGDYFIRYYTDKITLKHNETVLTLTGFENDIQTCEKPVLNIDGKYYICLIGEVGAHSQNLQIINAVTLDSISFQKDNILSRNLNSDMPRFDLNFEQIVSYNRDYDRDPLENILLDIYEYKEGVFTFDKTLSMP